MYDNGNMGNEGNSRLNRKLDKIEEELVKETGYYSVVVVDKQLQRHSSQFHAPLKLIKIIQAVFNYHILDHVSYAKEDGVHVVYAEPYDHIELQKIDTEIAKRFDVDFVSLKRSLHDCGTFPYKILIRNPGSLRKPDMSIGFEGV